MTNLDDTAFFARCSKSAVWLAFAVFAALPSSGPAMAAADSATAGAADEGAPRNTVVPRKQKQAEPSAPAGEGEPYQPPEPKVEHGELAQVSWGEAPEQFPPALEQAIVIVTRNYPSATSARAALRAASSEVRAAKWMRFPSISVETTYRNRSGGSGVGKFDPEISVETPIWSGGRVGAGIRRAEASEDASSASYVETLQSLALTTSDTYFEIVRLTQAERLLAESAELHNRLVQTMERRVKYEVSPVADLELARSRAAQIQQQYTATRAQRRTALRILAELVADPSYDLGPVPYYNAGLDLESRDTLEDQAVFYDPTLRRLRAQVDVAEADTDARRATIMPQVNAQYSYNDYFGSRVGVVVRAQTTGGLSQFSQVNAAKQRVQAAVDDVRSNEQQLRRDIDTEIIKYEAAKQRALIASDAADTAGRVSESYMRQFIAGRRSWLDVMNGLREAVTARISKADAEVAVMSSAARLVLRSGRWHPEFDSPESNAENAHEKRVPIQPAPRMPG